MQAPAPIHCPDSLHLSRAEPPTEFMHTAVIADDSPIILSLLRALLSRFWPDLQVIGEAGDGVKAQNLIDELQPDLVFLDIDMPARSGLEVARALPDRMKVVFITAYSEFAVEAFDVEAVDYILKPIDAMKIAKMTAKVRRVLGQDARAPGRPSAPAPGDAAMGDLPELQWIKLSVGHKVRMVHVSTIKYFASDHKYTRVVAAGADGLIKTPIDQLARALGADFISPRRGVLVQRRFIHAIYKDDGGRTVLEVQDDPLRVVIPPRNRKLFRSM